MRDDVVIEDAGLLEIEGTLAGEEVAALEVGGGDERRRPTKLIEALEHHLGLEVGRASIPGELDVGHPEVVGKDAPRVDDARRAGGGQPEAGRIANEEFGEDERTIRLGADARAPGATGLAVEEAGADVREGAAVGEVVVVEEVGDARREADAAVVADLGAGPVVAEGLVDVLTGFKKCQAGGVDTVRPACPFVLAHRVGHDADAAEGIGGLEGRRTLEELQMPHARPGVHRSRLAELADADGAEDRDLLLFPPDIEEARPADLGEVELDREVGELGELSNGRETGAAEADAILDVAVVGLARRRLAEEAVVDLEEPTHPDQGQLLRLSLEFLQPAPGLFQADVEVADLAGIEDGAARPVPPWPLEPPPRSLVDVPRLAGIEVWRPKRVGRGILGEALPRTPFPFDQRHHRVGNLALGQALRYGLIDVRTLRRDR